MPFDLAEAILRVLIETYPISFEEYEENIPELCSSLQQLDVTWVCPAYYMSIGAIIYRWLGKRGGSFRFCCPDLSW